MNQASLTADVAQLADRVATALGDPARLGVAFSGGVDSSVLLALATGLLGCSVWPAKKDPYPTGKADGAPPIVVVGTTGDPATPYE